MKIHYWSVGWNNFGDELNPWFWPRLMPRMQFSNSASQLLVGIGTLLNQKLPDEPMKHVFGSGVGYGLAPHINARFRFWGVRGPLSAEALSLDPARYVTSDPAIAISRIYEPRIESPHCADIRGQIGFMPHIKSERLYDWRAVAQSVGLAYVSPSDPLETVIDRIAACRMLLTEALHGAIVAEACRIPWTPVTSNDAILDFKWRDFTASIGLEYHPHVVPELYARCNRSSAEKVKDEFKRGLLALRLIDPHQVTPPYPRATGARALASVQEVLHRLKNGSETLQASESLVCARQDLIQERAHAFEHEFA